MTVLPRVYKADADALRTKNNLITNPTPAQHYLLLNLFILKGGRHMVPQIGKSYRLLTARTLQPRRRPALIVAPMSPHLPVFFAFDSHQNSRKIHMNVTSIRSFPPSLNAPSLQSS